MSNAGPVIRPSSEFKRYDKRAGEAHSMGRSLSALRNQPGGSS